MEIEVILIQRKCMEEFKSEVLMYFNLAQLEKTKMTDNAKIVIIGCLNAG